MSAGGQDQHRESHLISLKVMRLSRPSLVTGHSLYFGSPSPAAAAAAVEDVAPTPMTERPNMTSILTDALSELSLSQLERVHPASSARLVHPTSSLEANSSVDPEARVDDDTGDGGWDTLEMGDFGVSELLIFPTAFGNIFLGETFTTYICANNESAHPVRDVILKAELQTATSRFALSDTLANQRHLATTSTATTTAKPPSDKPLGLVPSSGGHIQSGKTNEMVVSHEIKELGVHILVCSVQYTTLDGQQKSFRKIYKFQVINPLSVKTKVNQPSSHTVSIQDSGGNTSVSTTNTSRGGLVLLEAMVQNVSGVTMWMERMHFEVTDAFTARDLNVVIDDDGRAATETRNKSGTVSVFGEHDYFAPNEIRQYLYVLTPRPGKELLAKTTNILGKMDILWKSQFGETGRLQTSQLTRKPTPLDSIAVQVVKVPESIRLEEIFTIEIVIKNQSMGDPRRQSSSSLLSGQSSSSSSGSMLGGMLARPPAAVSRGGVAPLSRPVDSSSLSQQQPPPGPVQDQNTMKLMLTGVKQKMGAILLNGPNSRQLGTVPAGGEVRVRLDWFPLTSGVQKIGGIRIQDIITGYSIELEHLTNCFVEHT
ncbi:hypothetical protein BGZ65_004042 [Modicella reniformis]|uniref:Trafficking protein particle complex subunit 13 n=1 Tax=Modicella reniformis TaxID=1440133 RepID=A0A9P6MHH7_9FUNG|nr:hypothetical protein BGZ65_004042 [Modicella reniformis]